MNTTHRLSDDSSDADTLRPRCFAYHGSATMLLWMLPPCLAMLLGPIMCAISLTGRITAIPVVALGNFVLGFITALGAVTAVHFWFRTWKFLDAVRRGIRTDAKGLRIPDWDGSGSDRYAWEDVEALAIIRCGGLIRPPIVLLYVDGSRTQIPAWLEGRYELVQMIIERAGLTEAHSTWWERRYGT